MNVPATCRHERTLAHIHLHFFLYFLHVPFTKTTRLTSHSCHSVSKPHDAHALTQGTALGLALFGTVVFFSFLFIQVSMVEAFPYALENFHVRDYESS